MNLVVVDACGANMASVLGALKRLDIAPVVTADAALIASADRVILPGVGAAGDAMTRLQQAGLTELIPSLTQPVLGICVGMQVLFAASAEDNVDCLGVFQGRLQRLPDSAGHPVPHMGWNQLQCDTHALVAGLGDEAWAYFVHSYAAAVDTHTIATCHYSVPFTAAVAHRNFHGVQFHPERSSRIGSRVLQNFLEIN